MVVISFMSINSLFIINYSMSELLVVRRQKFVREIRRREVDQYMKSIRDKLISNSTLHHEEEELTQAAIKAMKSELERDHYCQQAIYNFLKSLSKYSSESLCNPYFMAIFEVGLMHCFQKQKLPNNLIKYLAQDVLLRMITCKPNQNGSLPIEKCFKEVLELLAYPFIDLFEVWKGISMLRCSVFLQQSFNQIRFVLHRFNEEQLVEKMSPILQVFAGFTATIQGSEKISISISSVADIIVSLQRLLDSFNFCGEDIVRVATVLQNILKMHCFEAVATLLKGSTIYATLLQYLSKEEAESIGEDAICRILQFFYISFGGASIITEHIVSKTQNLLKVLTSFLPAIPVLQQKYGKWPYFSKKVLLKVMMCFCNLACCENFSFPALKYSIIDWSIAYSKHPDPQIQKQVSIFLFNISAMASDEQLEILLQKNMLEAVSNLIKDNQDGEVCFYGLRALKTILQSSKNFPDNNKAWCFNPATVAFHCRRLSIANSLQCLFMGHNPQNSSLANKCLDLIPQQ